ncbi:MAG: hypothetical protein JRD89_12625 [Deltaproteobacteria bacterium]|nr:hypothetical protein [Deltaproteobacteria bacterium]
MLPINQDLLDLYNAINTAFVKDFSALSLVFEVYGIRCTQAEAKEVLYKLSKIHQLIKGREIEDYNRETDARRGKAKR